MSDGMVMAPVPPGTPTPQQQSAANQWWPRPRPRYQVLQPLGGQAAGYVPATNPNGRVCTTPTGPPADGDGSTLSTRLPHVRQHGERPRPHRRHVPRPGALQPGPDVGGPLTQWHAHDNLCLSADRWSGGRVHRHLFHRRPQREHLLHAPRVDGPSLAAKHQFQADLPGPAAHRSSAGQP